MFVGIRIGDDTYGITDGDIRVDLLSILKSPSITKNVALILLFDDYIFPYSRCCLFRSCVADFTHELCHVGLQDYAV